MKRPTKSKYIALTFLIIAIVLAVIEFFIFSMDHAAASFSFPLQKDFTTTQTFHVPIKTEYEIDMRFRRMSNIYHQEDLLRGGFAAEFELLDNGKEVPLDYFPKDIGGSGTVDSLIQQIAYFKGDPKANYTIVATVTRPINELNEYNPIVDVSFTGMEEEDFGYGEVVIALALISSIVISICSGVVYLYKMRHYRS